ncbi:protein of unknown function DUF917 [Desulforamulus reducens MI-1]|uniref:DUF917 domain-containing protein n=1 Tax=Desulforamulus reducens (strain ATCC BAA-1160 / DSM 100696 / MI-1) TaxID=349161 RepID=A4J1J0_DESRM|nr:DUF917 domain-containing protein [Desulforamulus reducens]ABO48943.1 protein of unknown function DUF917 [Desulforamulus reducens MI-1]
MKKLSKQDLYDILYGCTILGTGGGGALQEGLTMIDDALDRGKEFILVDLSEVPDDAYIATPYMCGAISPLTEEEERKYVGLAVLDEEPSLRAFRAMEEYMGKEFYGVVSTELGGGNTAKAFYVGAMAGKYIIDADPAGRSVPELQHSTYYINNLPIAPMAVANEFGDVVILKEVANDLRAEALVRAMAVVSKNSIGVVDHPASAKDLRKAVIPGAITYALKLGQAYREAREENNDLAEALCKAGKGYLLFKGTVKDFGWDTIDGFTVGETYLEGTGDYTGSTYKIWYKNEHIIAWRNGEVDVTVPDLICMVCEDNKEPVTNPNYQIGMNVAVFALPAPAEWRTEKGLDCFGPKHFGYNIEYLPVEKKIG